jgi:hypothetical protein
MPETDRELVSLLFSSMWGSSFISTSSARNKPSPRSCLRWNPHETNLVCDYSGIRAFFRDSTRIVRAYSGSLSLPSSSVRARAYIRIYSLLLPEITLSSSVRVRANVGIHRKHCWFQMIVCHKYREYTIYSIYCKSLLCSKNHVYPTFLNFDL